MALSQYPHTYICRDCPFTAACATDLLQHYYPAHGWETDDKGHRCPIRNCRERKRLFRTFRKVRIHLEFNHGNLHAKNRVVCPYCKETVAYVRRYLVWHLYQHAAPGRSVDCPVNKCCATFDDPLAFRLHIVKKHYFKWRLHDLKPTLVSLRELEGKPTGAGTSTFSPDSPKKPTSGKLKINMPMRADNMVITSYASKYQVQKAWGSSARFMNQVEDMSKRHLYRSMMASPRIREVYRQRGESLENQFSGMNITPKLSVEIDRQLLKMNRGQRVLKKKRGWSSCRKKEEVDSSASSSADERAGRGRGGLAGLAMRRGGMAMRRGGRGGWGPGRGLASDSDSDEDQEEEMEDEEVEEEEEESPIPSGEEVEEEEEDDM